MTLECLLPAVKRVRTWAVGLARRIREKKKTWTLNLGTKVIVEAVLRLTTIRANKNPSLSLAKASRRSWRYGNHMGRYVFSFRADLPPAAGGRDMACAWWMVFQISRKIHWHSCVWSSRLLSTQFMTRGPRCGTWPEPSESQSLGIWS